MKTRSLMLLSVACGLAIMLAGAVLLVQLAASDDVAAPVSIGTPTTVGDMAVTVTGFGESGGELRVDVRLSGTDDPDPADDFRLIAAGRPAGPSTSTCPAIDDAPVACSLTFDVGGADGRSRVLVYERGEERARWVVEGP